DVENPTPVACAVKAKTEPPLRPAGLLDIAVRRLRVAAVDADLKSVGDPSFGARLELPDGSERSVCERKSAAELVAPFVEKLRADVVLVKELVVGAQSKAARYTEELVRQQIPLRSDVGVGMHRQARFFLQLLAPVIRIYVVGLRDGQIHQLPLKVRNC